MVIYFKFCSLGPKLQQISPFGPNANVVRLTTLLRAGPPVILSMPERLGQEAYV